MNRDTILAWRDDYQMLLRVGTLATVFLTWCGLFSEAGWLFDLPCHFRVEYLVVQILFLPAAVWGIFESRQPSPASVATMSLRRSELIVVAVSAALNAMLVGQLWLPPSMPAAAASVSPSARTAVKPTLKLLQLNVNSRNERYADVASLVHESNVDIVALQEVNLNWYGQMKARLPEYRHYECFPRPDNFGIALFSRIPLTKVNVVEYGKAKVPTVVAEVQFDGAPLTILSTHPLPPSDWLNYDFRNDQFDAMAKARSTWSKSVVLSGDLNTTSWSDHFTDLCKQSNLRDSRQGFGVQVSWPVQLFVLSIPIDHVLVSEDLEVKARSICRSVGSDHYPVLVEFARRP